MKTAAFPNLGSFEKHIQQQDFHIPIALTQKELGFMDLKSLWIGDTVRIISRKAIGSFEGIGPDGQARVRHLDALLNIPAEDLEPWDEPIPEFILPPEVEELKPGIKPLKNSFKIFDGIIDLHYEKLAPDRISNPHPHILEFQLMKCKEFIEEAIRRKVPYLRIIHGIGEGKLRAAVEHLLTFYPDIHSYYSTPDLGAVEVRMQFRYG